MYQSPMRTWCYTEDEFNKMLDPFEAMGASRVEK